VPCPGTLVGGPFPRPGVVVEVAGGADDGVGRVVAGVVDGAVSGALDGGDVAAVGDGAVVTSGVAGGGSVGTGVET
jgi:hypothetical protein